MKEILKNFIKENRLMLIFLLILTLFLSLLNIGLGLSIKNLVDNIGSTTDRSYILFYVLVFVSIRLLYPIVFGLVEYLCSKIIENLELEIKDKYYFKILSLDTFFHNNKNSGASLNKMIVAVNHIKIAARSIIITIIPVIINLIFTLVLIHTSFGLKYSIGTAVILFLYGLSIVFLTRKRIPVLRNLSIADKKLMGYIGDSFINFESFKIFSNAANEKIRFNKTVIPYLNAQHNNRMSLFKMNIISAIVAAVGCFFILYAAALEVISQLQTLGSFLMLTTFLFQSFLPLNAFGMAFRQVSTGKIEIKNLDEVFDKQSDKSISQNKDIDFSKGLHFKLSDISVTNVGQANIIKNLNGEIFIDKITYIIGESGVGKSILGKLISKIIRIDNGFLYINNYQIDDVDSSKWFDNVSYCSQDNILFNASIKDNLLYVKPEATIDELLEICHKVGLTPVINKLPNGLDTLVGERGQKLSGGERQRVALARALLKNTKLIILDEPSTGLDQFNKDILKDMLTYLSEDRFLLVITHDESLIVENKDNFKYKMTPHELIKLP